jgi:hypothetical protein
MEASIDGAASKIQYENPSQRNYVPLIYLDAHVYDKPMKLMIDTGASRTLISQKALNSIQNSKIINRIQRQVFLADGYTSITVYGEVDLSFIMNNIRTSIRALIVKNLCVNCILGMDYIIKYKLIINTVDRKVTIGVKNYRLALPMANGEEDSDINKLFNGEPPALASVSVDIHPVISAAVTRSRKKQHIQQASKLDKFSSSIEQELESSFLEQITELSSPTPVKSYTCNQFDIKQIKLEQAKDLVIQKRVKELQQNPTRGSFVLQDGLLYKLMPMNLRSLTKIKLIYIPSSMINSVLKAYHSDPSGGHFSIRRTYYKLKNRYWWPDMKQSVARVIKSCLCMPIDTKSNYVFYNPADYCNQLKNSLQIIQQYAPNQSIYSHMNNKKYYDKNRSNSHYEINDKILIRIHGLRSKLDPQYALTPKVIIRTQHPTYWVQDQLNHQITRVHVNDIRPILLS